MKSRAEVDELRLRCIRMTHEWTERCNDTFGLHLPRFDVRFGLKGTTAGMAYIGRSLIQYNPTLLEENEEVFLRQTVGHEVVHHAAYALHGNDIKGHGREWQSMMWKVGLPNNRCHTYDTSNVPTRISKVRSKHVGNVIQLSDRRIITSGGIKVVEFD